MHSSSSKRLSVLGRPGSDLLFQALRLSTIGAGEFNGRVRDGIGYRLPANTTRPAKDGYQRIVVSHQKGTDYVFWTSWSFSLPRSASGPDCKLLTTDGCPLAGIEDERRSSSHERLVPVSSTHCCAYTPGLSTWWSTTALKGELVSRWVSRLDA